MLTNYELRIAYLISVIVVASSPTNFLSYLINLIIHNVTPLPSKQSVTNSQNHVKP